MDKIKNQIIKQIDKIEVDILFTDEKDYRIFLKGYRQALYNLKSEIDNIQFINKHY